MSFRLSQQAEADLIEIYVQGVERFGVAQAELYLDRLEHSFGVLGQNPHIARLRREISPPVRIHRVEAHIIVYLVDDDEQSVRILRVRHGRENWSAKPIE